MRDEIFLRLMARKSEVDALGVITFKPLPVRRLCLCAGWGLCRFVTNPTLFCVQDAISYGIYCMCVCVCVHVCVCVRVCVCVCVCLCVMCLLIFVYWVNSVSLCVCVCVFCCWLHTIRR